MFDHGEGWPGFFARHHRRRLRRGMLKWMVLKMLAEHERHGYELLQAFRRRGWGAPGPGSIYPILMMLEEAGYVASREEGGKRVYAVTEEGRRHFQEHADELDEEEGRVQQQSAVPLRDAMQRLGAAVAQFDPDVEPAQMERVVEILKRARKEIYTLLANE